MATRGIDKNMVDTTQMSTEEYDARVQAAEAELPEPGHERREALKRREDTLQAEIDAMAHKMLSGQIDPKSLEIVNEIAQKTQFLSVSNAQPGYVYAWVSKNQHGHHIQELKPLGWEVVQGKDPEALELKGQDGGTTRQLADVILMRIERERYIVLKAKEQAQTRQIQRSSASTLLQMGEQYEGRGIIVKPWGMNSFEGPEIAPRRLSRKQAMKMVDQALRHGTVPGMHVQRG
jgi:hypothetical protein